MSRAVQRGVRGSKLQGGRKPESVSERSFSATVVGKLKERLIPETLKRNMRRRRYKNAQGRCRKHRMADPTATGGTAATWRAIPSFWVSSHRPKRKLGVGLSGRLRAKGAAQDKEEETRAPRAIRQRKNQPTGQTWGWALGSSLHVVASRLVRWASRSCVMLARLPRIFRGQAKQVSPRQAKLKLEHSLPGFRRL